MKKFLAPTLVLFTVLLVIALASTSQGQSAEPGDPFTVGLRQIAAGLTSPVALIEPPDGSRRLFIVDQTGLIRVLLPNGQLLTEPFLDLRDRMVPLMTNFDERGLLGLAFHPRYAENGRFFVYYSAPLRAGAPAGWNCTSHISEFLVSADPNRADPGSERILLQVDKPQFNHNAGTVVFGPDGFLYISLGDGGGANDVGLGHVEDWYPDNAGGNGQDITDNLLGSILRIDVDGGSPYAVPRTTPSSAEKDSTRSGPTASAIPIGSPSTATASSPVTPGRCSGRRSRSSSRAGTTAGTSRKGPLFRR